MNPNQQYSSYTPNSIVSQPIQVNMNPLTNMENPDEFINEWSWGGFGLSWIFLFASKAIKRGFLFLILILILSPILGFVFSSFLPASISPNATNILSASISILISVYLGIKGRKISWGTGKWQSFDSFKHRQKILDKIGIIFFVIWGLIVIGFLVFGIILASKLPPNVAPSSQNPFAPVQQNNQVAPANSQPNVQSNTNQPTVSTVGMSQTVINPGGFVKINNLKFEASQFVTGTSVVVKLTDTSSGNSQTVTLIQNQPQTVLEHTLLVKNIGEAQNGTLNGQPWMQMQAQLFYK